MTFVESLPVGLLNVYIHIVNGLGVEAIRNPRA